MGFFPRLARTESKVEPLGLTSCVIAPQSRTADVSVRSSGFIREVGSSTRPQPPNGQRFSHPPGAGNYFLREAPPRGFRRLYAFLGSRDQSRSSCPTGSEPKLFSGASTGSLGSVGLRISSIVCCSACPSWGESKLLPGVPSISPGSVRAAGSEPKLSPGEPLVSMSSGGLAFASAACPSLRESGLLPGGSASPFGPLCHIWG